MHIGARIVSDKIEIKSSTPDDIHSKQHINSKYASYQRFKRELNVNKFMVNEVMREQYDEPYFLYHEEFKTILKTDVPESLSSTKDAFLLQCAIGCRISDFRKLMMDNIAITEDGIPYVRYLPKKTMRTQLDRKEKTTPLMLFAVDIIRRRGFDFDFVRHNPGINMLTIYIHLCSFIHFSPSLT
mgnify:CR=1 FL=1